LKTIHPDKPLSTVGWRSKERTQPGDWATTRHLYQKKYRFRHLGNDPINSTIIKIVPSGEPVYIRNGDFCTDSELSKIFGIVKPFKIILATNSPDNMPLTDPVVLRGGNPLSHRPPDRIYHAPRAAGAARNYPIFPNSGGC
jgi:hypothetical protein